MDPTYPLYPAFAFGCFILVLIPLPWHFQAWNTGTCMFMIWTSVVCLIQFINAMVWHGKDSNVAPIYCYAATRLEIGAGVALPACSLCIQRCLYRITSTNSATFIQQKKIRTIAIDLCICMGFPLLIMALTYIVQGHRFTIFEDIGCTPSTYTAWQAYPLYFMWPLVFGLIATVYCILTLRSFSARRSRFNSLYTSGHSLDSRRYGRLMLLSITNVVLTMGFSTWTIYQNATKIVPFVEAHPNFGDVQRIPSIIWRSIPTMRRVIEFDRWNVIICAIVFIAFFSFAKDTRGNYNVAFSKLVKRFISSKRTPPSPKPDQASQTAYRKGYSIEMTDCYTTPPVRVRLRDRETVTFDIRKISIHGQQWGSIDSVTGTIGSPPIDVHAVSQSASFYAMSPDSRIGLLSDRMRSDTQDTV
ncbi:STE3-domain-containing protein [Rickenella mellea]|uniref:STE3-domain-containing protein n=1 Tax=Rickenella mellea TaxID=50990 RepID=A0A4Y7PL94_9AGAM|nr:STE3-domain-containing protein [Rickenella mellea]